MWFMWQWPQLQMTGGEDFGVTHIRGRNLFWTVQIVPSVLHSKSATSGEPAKSILFMEVSGKYRLLTGESMDLYCRGGQISQYNARRDLCMKALSTPIRSLFLPSDESNFRIQGNWIQQLPFLPPALAFLYLGPWASHGYIHVLTKGKLRRRKGGNVVTTC